MAKLHTALLALFSVIFLVVGCSKTVEGESKKWEANKKKVATLAAAYPGMKPALDDRQAAAEKAWEAAQGMSGDAQVDAMAAANSQLAGGWVTDLDGVEAKLKKLRESAAEVTAKATDDSSRAGAKVAADDAKKTVDRVTKTLETGAKDDAGGAAVVNKVVADIDAAQSAIDKVSAVDKDKTDKQEADAKAVDDKAAAEKAAAEEAVADWTCEYCSTANKHDATACSSCGAPRSEKK